MLERVGFGIYKTGQLLVTAGDDPDRLSSEAARAMLRCSAPLPAASAQTKGHRLTRGGDRAANRALHMAAICRLRLDPRRRAYAARRNTDGLSKREILRCLKRYIAPEPHDVLTAPETAPTPPIIRRAHSARSPLCHWPPAGRVTPQGRRPAERASA